MISKPAAFCAKVGGFFSKGGGFWMKGTAFYKGTINLQQIRHIINSYRFLQDWWRFMVQYSYDYESHFSGSTSHTSNTYFLAKASILWLSEVREV